MVMRPATGWLSSVGRALLRFGLRVAFVLVLFEGAASLVLFTLELPDEIRVPSDTRRHTQHDPELGWVHVPALTLPDLYGPGRGLSVNEQGFRARGVYPQDEPANRERVICSGSGNTLGRGVADDVAWCAQLETRLPRLQTVNMGQYGYGLDQSFLWYLRDGTDLAHSVHIFAFSRSDFGRMQADRYEHRGKPRLRVVEGVLEIDNVPVPNSIHQGSWVTANATVLKRLRAVQLVRPLVDALTPAAAPPLSTGELADLSLRVFDELAEVSDARGSRLLLVYLPTFDDYETPRDLWRRRIRSAAKERNLRFVDLVEEIKTLPRRDAAALFQPNGSRLAYSDSGHAWVARSLLPYVAPFRSSRVDTSLLEPRD